MLIGWCGRLDCVSDCRDCYRVPEDEAETFEDDLDDFLCQQQADEVAIHQPADENELIPF